MEILKSIYLLYLIKILCATEKCKITEILVAKPNFDNQKWREIAINTDNTNKKLNRECLKKERLKQQKKRRF